MAESKVAGADGDITAAAFIIQFEAGVEIVVAGIKFIDGAGKSTARSKGRYLR